MIKVFVSQPMAELSEDVILEVRNCALKSVSEMYPDDVVVEVESYFKDYPPKIDIINVPLWYLGQSLKLLATADVAVFCSGWTNARGCVLEHQAAEAYGIKVVEMP